MNHLSRHHDINFNGVRNVAQAAVANRVRRFAHASSMAAYEPDLVYGRTDVTEDSPIGKGDSSLYYWNSKPIAERTLLEILDSSGIILALFRPCYIIGPRNQATVRGFRENAVKLAGRDPRKQYIREEEVAAAFLQAVLADMPGACNVAPDDFIRTSDVWQIQEFAPGACRS